ncbi:hypothetical protein GGR02_001438 [Anoxybacillus voinovskiensis]|uniref:Holin-like toxin n=1 Tax=Anoxybacteroides voinovskiense TaxID=230470 RepID=A0A840DX82_9BACL|nr:hypothetical protein [Anoxybacillus voinovskiensis]
MKGSFDLGTATFMVLLITLVITIVDKMNAKK